MIKRGGTNILVLREEAQRHTIHAMLGVGNLSTPHDNNLMQLFFFPTLKIKILMVKIYYTQG